MMCQKLITRKIVRFLALKLNTLNSILDALDSNLDIQAFKDRVALSEFQGLSTFEWYCVMSLPKFGSYLEQFGFRGQISTQHSFQSSP